MPYTPPSHRSPAASAPASPDASRRSSIHSGTRPSLPRSASYLTKHRRTPSAVAEISVKHDGSNQPTPPGTSDDLKSMATSSSVRQSPPPITDNRRIPNAAVISPPDSASSGSDDEDVTMRGRTLENLKELKDAISQIPLRRESSPIKSTPAAVLVLPSTKKDVSKEGMHHSFSTGALSDLGSRRGSHMRCNTAPSVSKSAEASLSASEEDSEEDSMKKPQMVRKKSGELVRPALRPSSHRRPSSMPGTPTFSKAVHFDTHLEHIRHFLQVDRPLAVSAGSSPADNYESDTEYPFKVDERSEIRSPPYEWEIITNNFPGESPIRTALPARLERVWMTNDQKFLHGSIAVANLAFHKSVVCRFTLDYWKTTSEVAAEYSHEIRNKEARSDHDRFTFAIKLADLAHLESKTLFFCIRYTVNGREYWDNNANTNFQVDFRKKHLPQNGKRGVQGAGSRPSNALPRSSRRANPNTSPRPKSMPVGFDDFDGQGNFKFDQPIHEYLGESGPTSLRLKSNKSTGSIASDNLSSRLSAPSGQAFANRYDFAASLSAAVQAAKDKDRNQDGLYMKDHRKLAMSTQPNLRATQSDLTPMGTDKAASSAPVAGTGSPNSSLASSSYEELVNKYCFFGSKQSSPQIKDGTLKSGRFDGADDSFDRPTANTMLVVNEAFAATSSAQHHSLHPRDFNPYFDNALSGHAGNSPAISPLKNYVASERITNNTMRPVDKVTTPASIRSASPASMVGNFSPFAGTSPNDFPYHAQHLQERFPFAYTETHAPAAILG